MTLAFIEAIASCVIAVASSALLVQVLLVTDIAKVKNVTYFDENDRSTSTLLLLHRIRTCTDLRDTCPSYIYNL